MRNNKKLIVAILITTIVINGSGFTPFQISASNYDNTLEWFTYEVLEDNTLRIIGCNVRYEPDEMYTDFLTVPSQIDGKDVVYIGRYAFSNLPSDIINVSISNGITTIENSAFENSKIYYVTLPNTVTNIGDRAFYNCKNLSYINNFPTNISLDKDVFTGCDNFDRSSVTVQVTTGVTTTNKEVQSTTSMKTSCAPTNNKVTNKTPVKKVIAKTAITRFTKKYNSKTAKIKLKKIKDTKYIVKISTDKSFTSKKTLTKKTTKIEFNVISNMLKNKKVLYVKARAYNHTKGKITYGNWSNVKKVIIKKK